jgi:hypothetical protein
MSEQTFETVKGAWRAVDGTFFMLPSRRFHADGRTPLPPDARDDMAWRIHGGLLRITSGGPTVALMALAALRRHVDDLEHEVIALARADCWSWRNIGAVLGRSPSAVHERFAKKQVSRRRRQR